MKSTLIALALGTTALATPAMAETLTFEGQGVPLNSGYGGLEWNNVGGLNAAEYQQSGYQNGLVSGNTVAFNLYAEPGSFSGDHFTLNSGYFTAAWNDGLEVLFQGYVGNVLTYSKSFTADTSGPKLQSFGWTNLSSVTFTTTGGTQNPNLGGGGTHLAIDNLTINGVGGVPEPAAWGLMLVGFGAVGTAMRRRSTTVAYA